MTERPIPPAEVIGFEEIDGRLRVRLGSGTVPIFDENGQAVIVNDPSIRQHLFPGSTSRPAGLADNDETWNPWRQGP